MNPAQFNKATNASTKATGSLAKKLPPPMKISSPKMAEVLDHLLGASEPASVTAARQKIAALYGLGDV